MKNDIYNIELLEFKKIILEEIELKLIKISMKKMRKNSIAYQEIINLLENINSKISFLEKEIAMYTNKNEESYSYIKVKTDILNDLFILKKELNMETSSHLLRGLLDSYKDYFLIDKLHKISYVKINLIKENILKKLGLYVCQSEDLDTYILYKLDDVIIYENIEYLDMKKFKKHMINKEKFYLSMNFTLHEVYSIELVWNEV